MPSDNTVAIAAVTAGASGGFALLGVAMTNWGTARRERRDFRFQTATALADTERLTWGDDWLELASHLQRLDARLAVAGVPQDLIETYGSVCRLCFTDVQATLERSGGQHGGMKSRLADSQRVLYRAIQAHLLRQHSARARANADTAAIEQARAVASDRR
jgi:hypothetical protein